MSLPNNSNSPLNPPLLNIPNILTSIRIAAIPGVVALLYRPHDSTGDLWAAGLFGFAFWTDFFDGMIARRTHTSTRLGRIMDPLADKLIVLAAALMLIHLERINVIIAILLLSREIAVSGLRSLAGTEGILISSTLSARIKAFAEGFALGFLILGPENRWLGIPWMEVGEWLLYVALGLALWSAAIYFRDYYRGTIHSSSP